MKWFSSNTLLGLFTHAGVIVISLVCLLLAVFRVYLPCYTHRGQEVIVPDVRHLSLDEAVKMLGARGLRHVVVDSLWRGQEEPLAVVQHDPQAFARVKVNRRIQLWLNPRVPPLVVFPELVYTSPDFARAQLESLGLKIGYTCYRPDLAKDAVIECRRQGVVIRAGEKIRKGTTIDLVIGTAIYAEPKSE